MSTKVVTVDECTKLVMNGISEFRIKAKIKKYIVAPRLLVIHLKIGVMT